MSAEGHRQDVCPSVSMCALLLTLRVVTENSYTSVITQWSKSRKHVDEGRPQLSISLFLSYLAVISLGGDFYSLSTLAIRIFLIINNHKGIKVEPVCQCFDIRMIHSVIQLY